MGKGKNTLSRRAFLMMTGGSGAALMVKPGEQLIHKLIPYVNPPVYPKPGNWAFYITTCRECPAGCGMMLWHRDGRVTKAEGNPFHPVNRGKLCARGQSAVLGEYNTNRLTKVLQKENGGFKESNWETALISLRRALTGGKKALVISDLQTGSLAEVMKYFTDKNGTVSPLFYEPLNYESLRLANKEMYGESFIPRHIIKDCDLIISFGAPFLETWLSPVEYANDFSGIHAFKENNIGKLIYLAPIETLTAVNADEFVTIAPGSEAGIIYEIIHSLAEKGFINRQLYQTFSLPAPNPLNPYKGQIEKIVLQITKAKAPMILSGRPEDSSQEGINAVKAATLLNELLGNKRRIDFSQPHALSGAVFQEDIIKALNTLTDNHILFIHNTNPAYSMRGFAGMIKKAYKTVYVGSIGNETAELADWILPVNYPLEDWGDYEPWKGTISLIQPAMQPIFDIMSAGDVFLQLTNDVVSRSFREVVSANWDTWYSIQNVFSHAPESSVQGQDDDSELHRQLLQKGYFTYKTEIKKYDVKNSGPLEQTIAQNKDNSLFLYAYSSMFFYDGRLSNRGWLQEIAHPVSNIAWQSWIDISPGTAGKLSIEDGDVVKLSSGNTSVEAPVRLSNKIAENTIALEIGQGHWNFGETANGIGINAFVFLAPGNRSMPTIKVESAGKKDVLLYLNPTKDQHERELIREVDVNELIEGKGEKDEITWPTPEGYKVDRDLYRPHEHNNHRWAMVIDLQACIGCKACETACYAENNIPVVGKENCKTGKVMTWLKIPPYYLKNGKKAFIPMPCQHCDAAPCEPVCPVFAAVHTEEGLNAQIYNRCVGTRYCSNNCPYKVRRFNWANNRHPYPGNLQLNPEVTVRVRGVMEKCTFCVQRIKNKEYKAKRENRKLLDGEVLTACQQTCPTNAIVFGDLYDENSMVRKLMDHGRRYQLLHELNTKSAVIYLKKINVTL